MPRSFQLILPLLTLTSSPITAEDAPLNHFQVVGTHNSYHLQPGEAENKFIRVRGQAQVDSLAYSHPPLPVQFDAGIRQIELDLYADPEGGNFANPAIFKLSKLAQGPAPAPFEDPEGDMSKAGTKILHFPDFDFRTNVTTLAKALQQTHHWSLANPKHHPILVLLELKGSSNHWDTKGLHALEKEILATIPRKNLLTPDDVRGQHPNLRTAVLTDGWPSRDSLRGKLILALDNTGSVLGSYLTPDPTIKGRLLFPSTPDQDHPSAGFFKINDPLSRFALIKNLSEKGFLIRTRADANTREARANDTTRRDKAFASGAHFISTDFPKANPDFSDYQVTLPAKAHQAHRFRK